MESTELSHPSLFRGRRDYHPHRFLRRKTMRQRCHQSVPNSIRDDKQSAPKNESYRVICGESEATVTGIVVGGGLPGRPVRAAQFGRPRSRNRTQRSATIVVSTTLVVLVGLGICRRGYGKIVVVVQLISTTFQVASIRRRPSWHRSSTDDEGGPEMPLGRHRVSHRRRTNVVESRGYPSSFLGSDVVVLDGVASSSRLHCGNIRWCPRHHIGRDTNSHHSYFSISLISRIASNRTYGALEK